jgi:AN1-like Zinc finger
VIICPICETRIKMKALQDPNQLWATHSASGKCVQKPDSSGRPQQAKKCMADKCYAKLSTVNSVTCQQCLKEVCLKHRFEDDHQCTHIVRNQQTAKSKLLQPGYFKEKPPTGNVG